MEHATYYKYIDAYGAFQLLLNRQLFFRRPLDYEKNDCRIDLLHDFDSKATAKEIIRLITLAANGDLEIDCDYKGFREALKLVSQQLKSRLPEDIFQDAYSDKDCSNADAAAKKVRQDILSKASTPRILCLTKNGSSKYMWQKYAKEGSGCMIGFAEL
ncbi:MAG: hypothetical protein RIG82_01815 [Phycisphaeraceae bacterium]